MNISNVIFINISPTVTTKCFAFKTKIMCEKIYFKDKCFLNKDKIKNKIKIKKRLSTHCRTFRIKPISVS